MQFAPCRAYFGEGQGLSGLRTAPGHDRGRTCGRTVGDVQHRLAHTYESREIRLISTGGFLVGAEIELARLESENLEHSDELETRELVERAKGIPQRDLKLTEEEAYRTLQRHSRQRRKPMKEVAEAILLADELRRGQECD